MKELRKNKFIKSSRVKGKLFAYGTLRNAPGHKFHHLLKEKFDYIGKGEIRGNLYDLGKYPGAVISRSSHGRIVGELFEVKDDNLLDLSLKILDEYEGYDETNASCSEYIRKKKFVKLRNGKKLLSWVYIYNWPVNNRPLIRSGDYIRHSSAQKAF